MNLPKYDESRVLIFVSVIRAINKALEEDWTQHAAKYDLTSPQLHLLWVIKFKNGSTVTELSNYGLWHISTTMHLIDKLEQKELLYKERLAEDKRTTRIFLTTKGEALAEDTFEQAHHYDKLHSILENKIEEYDAQVMVDFCKEVMFETYGKEFRDYIEASSKQLESE